MLLECILTVKGEGMDEGRKLVEAGKMMKVRRTEEQQDGLLKNHERTEGFSNRGKTVKWMKMKHSHRGSSEKKKNKNWQNRESVIK